MVNYMLKPLTCATLLGMALEAGCGGTINLSQQKGGAGSGSGLAGSAGAMSSASSGASSGGGRDGEASSGSAGAGSGGAKGSPAASSGGPSTSAGTTSRVTCGQDGDPCGVGDGVTCEVRNADPKNCGICGNACSSGQLCFAGVCASPPAACSASSTLPARPPLVSGTWPEAMVIGDWNADGITDLAAANSSDGTVAVFLGCGVGTFAPRADYQVAAHAPVENDLTFAYLTSCDVNADGKLDLVTAGYTDRVVAVLSGTGDGTFAVQASTELGDAVVGLACAEFDRDGRATVAVSGGLKIRMLLDGGDGPLQTSAEYTNPSNLGPLKVGDVNADGRADLVAVGYGAAKVLLGRGDGTFAELPESKNGGHETDDFALADLTGDGYLDLGVGDQQPRGVSTAPGLGIMPGHGDGTFDEIVELPPAVDIVAVASGDVNGDDRPDLVGGTRAGSYVVFGAAEGGAVHPEGKVTDTGFCLAQELGDMDGDGKLDLVTTKISDSQVYLYLGNGDGTFRP